MADLATSLEAPPLAGPHKLLLEAALFERDRRAERYPALVRDRKLGADEATLDYQCWCVIAAWFETGQFTPVDAGGADELTIVEWALCEDAAAKALAKIAAKADGIAPGDPAFADTHRRRAGLVCIHRAIQLRRQSIETLNRQFRARRRREIAA